jgi:hypothetical protein
VVDEAKNKAEKLLEDVDELLEQIRGKKSNWGKWLLWKPT